MDDVEPKIFFQGRVWPKPSFKILIGGLPILPIYSSRFNGASFGTKVIGIKRF